ncbi:hypothetical protein CLU96_2520 [Chryseobacterium sp. 52]|uniref:hypothetical protein n=1 Tax=Chryseobacterium sp. 52 TaxID=2035213 RepID=UPI000C5A1C8B|nr:hypothetical protein [Chryseobacterium sp. 52]PIF45511.1 hypothetical protein CLU96_2520 [Chryseobacterium sp. 52]
MKRIILGFLLLSQLSFSQVGIMTSTPHPSALLELYSSNKGLLVPKIALTNSQDKITIPNPAEGLLVFNINTSGTPPLNVVAGKHYFWNGTDWISLPGTQTINNLITPKFCYVNSSSQQSINASSSADIVVTFPTATTTIVNPDSLVSFDSTTNIFTVNITGLYELSAYINYNPKGSSSNRALFNLKIQKQSLGNTNWVPVSGAYLEQEDRFELTPLSKIFINTFSDPIPSATYLVSKRAKITDTVIKMGMSWNKEKFINFLKTINYDLGTLPK